MGKWSNRSTIRRFHHFAIGRKFHKHHRQNWMAVVPRSSKNSRRHSATDACIYCRLLQKATSNHATRASMNHMYKYHLRIRNPQEHESLNIRESQNFRQVLIFLPDFHISNMRRDLTGRESRKIPKFRKISKIGETN